ncbi:target of Nesh-SH3 isoform X3 [Xiphias gladius]|uniref:target of Nesh-SH3 isoform X3 n=1 Tax=Xiphias gladius TaxID=8245 RepID=UPI001A989411|nr:target of Nesh-SH3 isoform X3 [Xiphias gladius]
MMRMQQYSHSFLALLLVVFVAGIVLSGPSTPRKSRVRRQNMKVRISATEDTIVMKFLRPNADTKLEGYILGYGSGMFSKQFIQLPENGQPYETEFDAEPKYLIAVQPIPTNEVKKQCTGKVELEKPLHLVIGSVTPTSVLLSWGTLLKTPYEGNVMNDCLEDGHYTVRYRERNRKWNYQTCPTSDTVIDNLKPNTVYEFGVQPNSKDASGVWSKPVIHNISTGGTDEKAIRKIFKRPVNPVKPLTPGPHSFPLATHHVVHNKTQGRVPVSWNIASKTTLAPTTTTRQESLSTPGPTLPVVTKQPLDHPGGGDLSRSVLPPFLEVPLVPKLRPPLHITPTMASVQVLQTHVEKYGGHPMSQPQQKPLIQPLPNQQLQPQYRQTPQPKPQPQHPQVKLHEKAQPQLKSYSQTQPQSQPRSSSQPVPQTQPQPEPKSQPISKTQPQPEPTSEPAPQTQPQPQPQPTYQPVPETQPQTKSQPIPKAQPQPQPTSQLVPRTEPQPTPQLIPQTQPQPQPTSTLIPQTQPQQIAKLIPQTQPQRLAKLIPQTQPQPQPISKLLLQTQPKPLPQQKSHPVPQAQPQTEPTTELIPHTLPQPEATSQLIPQTQPQPQQTSKLTPQTQPQPQSQQKSQTQPHPQPQPTSQPTSQTQLQPQPQPTSQPIPQTLSQTQKPPQPKLHTQPQSQSKPKPYFQTQPQTTTQFQVDPQPQPHPKNRDQHQTRPQIKTKTELQPHVESTPQFTSVSHPHTPQQTTQHIPHTQRAIPQIHIQPQPQPQSQSTAQPQTQTQLQPKTNPQSQLNTKKQPKAQQTSEPKINFFKPKPKTQPQPKSKPKPQPPSYPKMQPKPQLPSQPKKQPKPQTRDQKQTQPKKQPQPQSQPLTKTQTQPIPNTQPIPQLHSPPKTQGQSQSVPLPKPHPASRPKPQPQPGLSFQPKTKTSSDPTKITPRQTVPTAPSPPEEGKPLPRPALATERAGSYNHGTGDHTSSIPEVPRSPISSSVPPAGRNNTLSRTRVPTHSSRTGVRPVSPSKTFTSSHSSSTTGGNGVLTSHPLIPSSQATTSAADGAHHRGNALPKPVVWSKENPVLHPPIPVNKRPNLVGKPSDHDKPMDLKQGDGSILKPFPLVTSKPKQERKQQITTSAPALNSSRFEIYENSSIFRPLPASEVDIMGKKRFIAPHVIYKTDKKPDEPCSITSSLAYFPDEEEGSDQNVTGPPRIPPSNLTVVTVEGCPSFVILDWQKTDNETREYEVVSTAKGPNGEEVSILTTNQTHTAVENLKPESSYEFKVTPKNELGTGPSSDPVSFSTESADPRVSENASGKDAIWTQFPFKADAHSECNGKQYVKRTWYRKFVGIQLCNSLRYKIYLSDSLNGKFYNIGDQTGHGEDHCQFVDSFLDGRTGTQMLADQLPSRPGFYRAMRQEPVNFGEIGGKSHVTYVGWYECGTPIPGKW